MPSRDNGGRRTIRPFNWLEKLDKWAATLSPAADRIGPYGPFMLARYPNLRPQPIQGNARSRTTCQSGERAADQTFVEWESRIAGNTETAVCLEGLDAEQRRQLAALLLETVVDLEMRTCTDRISQTARHIRDEAATRLRGLDRRLKKARRAVEELMAYAQDSETGNALDALRHPVRQMFGQPYKFAAGHALRALEVKGLFDAEEQVKLASESLTSEHEDPEVFGMVQLYWFFRHGCSLTGHESEVRVARLRNAFWTEHSVSKVKYRAKYDEVESQGCAAVHLAVWRF